MPIQLLFDNANATSGIAGPYVDGRMAGPVTHPIRRYGHETSRSEGWTLYREERPLRVCDEALCRVDLTGVRFVDLTGVRCVARQASMRAPRLGRTCPEVWRSADIDRRKTVP